MRRSILGCAVAVATVALAFPVLGSTASAQTDPSSPSSTVATSTTVTTAAPAVPVPGPGCSGGDLVSASITTDAVPGGAWKVDKACGVATDFYTGVYQDQIPFTIGITNATYADGHVGRLAALQVKLGDKYTLTVVGMEDAATGQLQYAATIDGLDLPDGTPALKPGEGLSFPPLANSSLTFSLTDTAAPMPTTTTTTVDPNSATTLPSTIPTSSVPDSTTTTTTDQQSTSVPATTIPAPTVPDSVPDSTTTTTTVPKP